MKRVSLDVYVEIYSKKSVIDHTSKSFQTRTLDAQVVNFINHYIQESPYYYIALLDFSKEQGAIPTCTKNRLSFYHDLSASEYKCYEGKWTYYTSKSDIYEIEKHFKEIGVDFIFSPFVLLSHFFKDKIDAKMAMYILIEEDAMSLTVFEHGELLYAEYLDMDSAIEQEADLLSSGMGDDAVDIDSELNIDLEDVDVMDDIEGIDDFGDIEDLDSLEEIDEFDEDKDLEEELLEVQEPEEQEHNDTNFNEDYQRFSLINTSIGHFYNDTRYKSEFIETVYIADGIGVSGDLKRYLEEEMFLNVYIRHINLPMELCEVTKMELVL